MKYRSGGFFLWAVAIVVVAWGGYLLLADGAGPQQRRGGMATAVKVEVVHNASFADTIEAIGTAKANESVILTARVSEAVQSVSFEDGGFVSQGDVIVELTNSEERAFVAEAQATVREAEAQYERVLDLEGLGSASSAVVDNRLRQLEEARERLNAAQARLADRIIRAPFSGILGLRNVSQGALVSPGLEITTLDDVEKIKLDFSVPERFLSALTEGQQIEAFAAAYKGRAFVGEVKTVSSRVDPVSRAVTVRALIDNADHALRPGMLLTLTLSSNQRMALSVPPSALVPMADKDYLFVVSEENKVSHTEVEVGQREDTKVEILGGLVEGDVVVVSGTLRLRNGANVTI
ncbi:MAG: efflux RND transporter periplasmic adaptor subunit, partial [Sphingomonadales bacterium]|nr:efflux RND transporter periplasmic adaptor subunit [Sphingomonadales bacterium]